MRQFYKIAALALAALVSTGAIAGPNDFIFMQRNALDSGNTQRVLASPATTGFFTYNATTKLGGYTTIGSGLTLDSGVLSATLVPGPVGATGATGPTGAQGVAGASAYQLAQANGYTGTQAQWLAFLKGETGATGATGQTGAAGKDGTNGANGAKGDRGDTGATGAQGPAGTPAPTTLRLRAQTNTSGIYAWTFPTPFPAGTVPVVSVTVEDASTASWNHAVSNVTNTGFTVTLGKTTSVTLLGISVLGVASSPQAYVHLTATAQ